MPTYVVTHDLVSFRDPEDPEGTLKEHRSFLSVARGEELPEGVSEREIKQGLKLGAIAEDGSDEAEYAKRGLPRSAGLLGGISSTPSPLGGGLNEKDQIAKAVLSGVPGPANASSSIEELMRLPGDHIAVMARALGAEVTEDATKRNLVEFIVGKGPDATSADEIAEQRAERDGRQLAARDFGGEHGLSAAPVEAEPEKKPSGSKQSGGKPAAAPPASEA